MITFKAVTPKGTIVNEEVKSIYGTSVLGDFTLLPKHMPVVYQMVPCRIALTKEDGTKENFAMSTGFLYFDEDKATLLTDAFEPEDQIDVARAQAALQRAEDKLAHPTEEIDIPRAKRARTRAMVRLKVANLKNRKKS